MRRSVESEPFQHVGRRRLLPSQVTFASGLDPNSGELPYFLRRRIPVSGSRSVEQIQQDLRELLVEDCALHSRYYFDGRDFLADCEPSLIDKMVVISDDGDAGVTAGAALALTVNRAVGSDYLVEIVCPHWVADDYGMDVLAARVTDRLSDRAAQPQVLSRAINGLVASQQLRAATENLERLDRHRSVPNESYIATRRGCDPACTSGYCQSTQNELGSSLSAATAEALQRLMRVGFQPSAVAFASYCRSVAEHWGLPIAAVVVLFADRWGPAAELVTSLVNPRPVWLGGFDDPDEHFLQSAQRELMGGATDGFLESYDAWYEAALAERASGNVRLSFNFVRRRPRGRRTGVSSGRRDQGGRSLHQSWYFTPAGGHIETLSPDCCVSSTDLMKIVGHQVETIHRWSSALTAEG
jgi:hypothetical protein